MEEALDAIYAGDVAPGTDGAVGAVVALGERGHCVMMLNEYTQKKGLSSPQYAYQAQGEQGPFSCAVTVGGNEVGRGGVCSNKKEAKHAAAADAWQRLLQLPSAVIDAEAKDGTEAEEADVRASGANCIMVLNEHTQKNELSSPQYAYDAQGTQGPFMCMVTVGDDSEAGRSEAGRSEWCTNKKQARHGAAVNACRTLGLLL